MRPIAYTQRVCTDPEQIATFLSTQRVGVLGLDGGDHPYAVPVNYVWLKDCFYFHGMGSGRKVELLREPAAVCFTVYHEYGTTTDPIPCHADTSYMSVIAFGQAERVADPVEATEALQALVDKLLPGYYRRQLTPEMVEKYRSAMDGNTVAVFRVTPSALTAKENRCEQSDLFQPSA